MAKKELKAGVAKKILEWQLQSGIDVAVLDPRDPKSIKMEDRNVSAAVSKPLPISIEDLSSMSLEDKTKPDSHSASDITSLEGLRQALFNLEVGQLKYTAKNLVFSAGVPTSDVMIIGEAPGADEDEQGLPFVGLSGQLLDRMLATIGLNRQENIYITNILPWRPPGNRQPTQDEIKICLPYVHKHIELIKPKIILLVGGVSAKSILDTSEGIMKLRGRWKEYVSPFEGFKAKLLATYHPAFLLRSPAQKSYVWQDLIMLKRELEDISIK